MIVSRHGNFTSSEIWKLTTLAKNKIDFGAPALNYIQERNIQRRLKKSFANQGSVATKWGNHFESIAFEHYQKATGKHLISYSNPLTDFRLSHIPNHGGTPDFVSFDGTLVGSIKCPFTEKAFVELYDIIKIALAQHFKKQHPEYYWQLISDSIVTKASTCVFVIYIPYLEDLESDLMDSEMYWLNNAPHLLPESEFTNLSFFEFTPPAEDVAFLTACIEKANKLLIPSPTILLASPIKDGILITEG